MPFHIREIFGDAPTTEMSDVYQGGGRLQYGSSNLPGSPSVHSVTSPTGSRAPYPDSGTGGGSTGGGSGSDPRLRKIAPRDRTIEDYGGSVPRGEIHVATTFTPASDSSSGSGSGSGSSSGSGSTTTKPEDKTKDETINRLIDLASAQLAGGGGGSGGGLVALPTGIESSGGGSSGGGSGVLGFIIVAVVIVLGIYFYRKSQKKKEAA